MVMTAGECTNVRLRGNKEISINIDLCASVAGVGGSRGAGKRRGRAKKRSSRGARRSGGCSTGNERPTT